MLIIGVGWYEEEEWKKVKLSAVDPERFEETYSEWVEMAEQAFAKIRTVGSQVNKSYIKAADLMAWCLAHDKPNDASSRVQFVSQQGTTEWKSSRD